MKRLLGITLLVIGASCALEAQSYTIRIFAGVLPPTTTPTQTNALFLAAPDAVVVDAVGNVFIADTNSHKVWKISPSQKVTLVAGTGAVGVPTDGKTANTQPMNQPSGLALDAKGNLFVSDRGSHRIFEIDTTGVITKIAGLGNGRFTGDGRAAIYAELNQPTGIAIGPDGNLYVADRSNNRVRKIDLTSGIITTVAGGGGSGNAGEGGPAVLAQLNAPEGVAFDIKGNLLIADTGNNRIKQVMAPLGSSAVVNTVAGRDLTPLETAAGAKAPYAAVCPGKPKPGQAATPCVSVGDGRNPLEALLASPSRIVVDNNSSSPLYGAIFFSDRGNNIIRQLTVGDNIKTVVGTAGSGGSGGDNGPPRAATLDTPNGLALDASDDLFFADRGNNRVRQWNQAAGVVQAVAGAATFNGDQTSLTTMFSAPTGIASDAAGNVYITDTGNNRIRKIDTSGNVTTLAGSGKTCSFSATNHCGDGGDAGAAGLNNPAGIWVDPSGTTIVFADTGNNRIRKISAGSVSTIAGGGAFDTDGLPATAVSLNLNGTPQPKNTNVRKFPSVASADGVTIFFTEPGNNVVREIQADGTLVTVAGIYKTSGAEGDGGPATSALFNYPTGVAVDSKGNIYVADSGNYTVRVISGGIIYPLAGEATAGNNDSESSTNPAYTYRWRIPMGVAVDSTGANLYVCDTGNNKVDKIAVSSLIATRIAGNNSNGGTTNEFAFDFGGDNVSGTSAQLSFPTGITVLANGDVIFTDAANNMLRVLTPASK
jgi:sugar lactone lactonase YvrE